MSTRNKKGAAADDGFKPNHPVRKHKEPKAKVVETVESAVEEPKVFTFGEHVIICRKCFTTGHRGDYCPESVSEAEEKASTQCMQCGKSGHVTADCDVDLFGFTECYFCGERSHTYHQCPQREQLLIERDGRKMESYIVCRNCGGVGHVSHECKQPSQRRIVCFRCGEVGHASSKCPKPAFDSSLLHVCRRCGEIGHFVSDCPEPFVSRQKCQLCGMLGHSIDNCPLDMPAPSTSTAPSTASAGSVVVEPLQAKVSEAEDKLDVPPAKQTAISSADLQDTEQFPSL